MHKDNSILVTQGEERGGKTKKVKRGQIYGDKRQKISKLWVEDTTQHMDDVLWNHTLETYINIMSLTNVIPIHLIFKNLHMLIM